MAPRQSSALRSLKYASSETSAFINGISNTSERLAERSTEALIGTFGGTLGASGGFGLVVLAHFAAMSFLTIPLGGALGIVSAMLLWRGPKRMLRERKQREIEAEVKRRQAFSVQQLKALGTNGDPTLIEYYREYPSQFLREQGLLPLKPENPPQIAPPPALPQITDQRPPAVRRRRIRRTEDEPAPDLPEGLEP